MSAARAALDSHLARVLARALVAELRAEAAQYQHEDPEQQQHGRDSEAEKPPNARQNAQLIKDYRALRAPQAEAGSR